MYCTAYTHKYDYLGQKRVVQTTDSFLFVWHVNQFSIIYVILASRTIHVCGLSNCSCSSCSKVRGCLKDKAEQKSFIGFDLLTGFMRLVMKLEPLRQNQFPATLEMHLCVFDTDGQKGRNGYMYR